MAEQDQAKKGKGKKAKKERSYKGKVIFWTIIIMIIDEITIGIPEADLLLFYIVLFKPKWFLEMIHKLYKYVPHRRAWRPVRDICQHQVVTVPPDMTVADAARFMRDQRVRSLLIVEEQAYNPADKASAKPKKKLGWGKRAKEKVTASETQSVEKIIVPLGVLSDRDITLKIGAEGLSGDAITVSEVMTTGLGAALETEDIHSAVEKMREAGARRLPVVDSRGALVGMLSLDDTISMLSEGLSDMVELLHKESEKDQLGQTA